MGGVFTLLLGLSQSSDRLVELKREFALLKGFL